MNPTRKLILIKHSKPAVEPDVPSHQWHLSEEGRRRCDSLAGKLAIHAPDLVIASDEPKAAETGRIVADLLHKPFCTAPGLHEHDRGNVRHMPSSQFISFVALFFQKGNELVLGRETAVQAHARFSTALNNVLNANPAGNLAVVTHGTVLSLFVASHSSLRAFDLWRRLGLPSFVVFALPERQLLETVERIP